MVRRGAAPTASMAWRYVAGLAAVVLLSTACDDTSSGTVSLTADESQDSLAGRDVHVPKNWNFGQMNKGQVFVGAPSFEGRYDPPTAYGEPALQPVATLAKELGHLNSSFPPMRQIPCDETKPDGLLHGYLGFTCSTGTSVYTATRAVDGQPGTPSQPDSDTFVLTHDGTAAHLFVLSPGD